MEARNVSSKIPKLCHNSSIRLRCEWNQNRLYHVERCEQSVLSSSTSHSSAEIFHKLVHTFAYVCRKVGNWIWKLAYNNFSPHRIAWNDETPENNSFRCQTSRHNFSGKTNVNNFDLLNRNNSSKREPKQNVLLSPFVWKYTSLPISHPFFSHLHPHRHRRRQNPHQGNNRTFCR